ncbi:DNA ligase 1-like [Ruditapes philippinarum]|uniref:DNA ligase 1-like n=1 Tax=Ruditapes philippinarum TaxID=129788 RepID=UPI00295B3E8B|nr:DNA ligase 1-like [Ruditapes philippinarum]
MATQEKEKIKVKHLEKALVKLLDEVKQKKTDNLSKTIRKDNMSKTLSDLHERLKKENSDSEFLEGDKGKSLVLNIREWEYFENLPVDFKQSISAFKFEEKKLADKKHGDVKNPPTPSSPKCSRTENQSVDVGSAPVPTPSSHKQRPGKGAETENHQEKIQTLEKELAKERNESEKMLHKFNDREKQIKELEKELKERDERNNFLEEESKSLAQSLGQEKKIRTAVENELKSAKDMVQRLEKHVNDDSVKCQEHQKRIAELEAANKKLEAAYKNLDKQKYHMEQQANKNMEHMQNILLEEKRKADDQYKKLLADRDDLRDRFSKLAGKKLQEQNADIADLSDPNRAMKVSEKFGQLYDDDWTNAFESLTDKKLGVPLKRCHKCSTTPSSRMLDVLQ